MGDAEEPIEDIEATAEEEEQIEAGGPKRRLLGPSMVRVLLYVAAALVMIVTLSRSISWNLSQNLIS